MKIPVVLLVLLLAGCAADPEPLPVPPQPVDPPPVVQSPPPAVAAQVAVVKHFDQAKAREPTVVLRPEITSERIREIGQADKDARAALTALGRQRNHATPAALDAARAAVRQLEKTLDDVP